MNILVVGGAGYIGRGLFAALLQTGDGHRVSILDKEANGLLSNRFLSGYQEHPQCDKVTRCNIVSDSDWVLDQALEGIDVVYHLAGASRVRMSGGGLYHAQDGFLGSVKLIDACRRHDIKKFIFTSSCAVYGNTGTKTPVDTTDSTFPISAYGVVKLAVEDYLNHARLVYNFPSTILRLANVYSDDMDKDRVIIRFMDNLLNNYPITFYGAGDSARDYIHLDDVIEALLVVLEDDWSGKTFNVGTGIETRLDELLSLCEKVTGRTAVSVNKVKAWAEDVNRVALDSTTFEHTCGWAPQVSLEYGLRKVYEERYQIPIAMA